MENMVKNLVKGVMVGCIVCVAATICYAEEKVAVVNVDELFDSYYKTVELNSNLEGEVAKRQQERDTLVAEIRRMKDELILLTEDNKKAKETEIDEKIKSLQKYDEKNRDELAEQRNEFMKQILVELDEKVKDFGKKKGYEYILNGRLVLFAKDKYDVTKELISEVNKK